MIQIYCKNTQTSKSVAEGTTLLDLINEFDLHQQHPIVAAKVNNVVQGLKFRVYQNRDVEFLDMSDTSAMRVYSRSLCFVMTKAAHDLFPEFRIYIEHPISNGLFCSVKKPNGHKIAKREIERLKVRMQEIIDKDTPFRRNEVQTPEAIRIFRDRGYDDKVKLLDTSGQVYVDYYTLGDYVDYFYGRILPSAGYLTVWNIIEYHGGMLLQLPDISKPEQLAPFNDQPKTFNMFSENLRWNLIMRLNNVGDVNHACLAGYASELIQVSEALQEKKIVQIAEEIERRYNSNTPLRVVLISGPSSSGKTTFCKRLSVQLKACGLRPISMSTDDYFVNRVDTPLLPNGQYDFDNFDTVDHDALQADVVRMLKGETVEVPEYNFKTGIREYNGKKMKLGKGTVLLVEGIHALNPRLTDQIPTESKFKIFISTLTSISLDNHNYIPPTDNRLLRRIVRDYNKGAFTARESIQQWPNVCKAEQKWIYPYQEEADVMFNSALLIEFAVMRNHAEPILASVPKNCPEYSEAHRLLKFMHYFIPVPDNEIPPTSLLREFLGGSSFKY